MKKLTPTHKALIRRYLIWAYKSTKESFDRLERKTTQLMADDHILKGVLQQPTGGVEYQKLVGDYKEYIAKKQQTPVSQDQHLYLKNRLISVERTIKEFLGEKELKAIAAAYEAEFIRRIWESRDH